VWSKLNAADWNRSVVLHRLIGLFSLALGVICAMESHRLWTGWAGSGVLPAGVAILFVVLAIGFAAFPAAPGETRISIEPGELQPVAVIVVAFAAYIAILPVFGFLLSTWAFLFGSGRVAAGSTWKSSFVCAGVLAVASHLLFRVTLGAAFPVGPWGF